ncbi:Phosphate transport system permease protein [Pyrodictium delaneyi]|uniref:Phosphate transport system permease protein n=2 Tax=Pyrodictium delaneyi TaxID=1273541 RepID=A0A0P0N309_9CREN|nr:phosphate ABC transporter permease subunit PstC [Pyrodictium delaneyi]ALL01002.1 Phosphate transport system permease protein [Pyrodictium delaneyi]
MKGGPASARRKRVFTLMVGGFLPRLRSRDDKRFFLVHLPVPLLVFLILSSMLAVILLKSLPILKREGISIFIENVWKAVEDNPEKEKYGLLAAIYGTLYTSTIAILIAAPLAVGLAVAIEELTPRRLRGVVSILVDLMAATPTIVYGVWGATYLAPTMKEFLDFMYQHFSWIPFFSEPPVTGYTIATAGVMLGIMIVPYAAAVIREAYSMLPRHIREAAYSIGATRFETIRILLGAVRPSIIAGLVLAFGRAMGETVAVSLVVGNSLDTPIAVTRPGITVSSLIASMFKSASYYEYMESALFAGGLALFVIGLVVNTLGILYIKRWEEEMNRV